MKKIVLLILIIKMSLILVSCRYIEDSFADKSKLQVLSLVEKEEHRVLIWQDKEFQFYKNADGRLKGDSFGIIEKQNAMNVYTCIGQKPEEWLLLRISNIMGEYLLYKETSVTEIPEVIDDFEINTFVTEMIGDN